MASLLILGGVLPLAGAYLSQVMWDLKPCHFCLLQRYPYVVLALLGGGLLMTERMGLLWRALVALGILALLTTLTLGLIHTGIETGYLQYSGGCVSSVGDSQSLDAIRAALLAAPLVSCKDAAVHFLGLSMASWNSIWAALVIGLIALQYRFERRRRVVL